MHLVEGQTYDQEMKGWAPLCSNLGQVVHTQWCNAKNKGVYMLQAMWWTAPMWSSIGTRIEAPKRVGCRERVFPTHWRRYFLLLALKMVSFGAFWAIFLQFSCLFTAYANVMPVRVTDSDKPNE